jgi:hypothetical protein
VGWVRDLLNFDFSVDCVGSFRNAATAHDTDGDMLLRGWGSDFDNCKVTQGIWAGKDDDTALTLWKTIQTLVGFVECSAHFPGTPNLAQQLMAISWPLRVSPFPQIRRAVILAVACTLKHTCTDRLMTCWISDEWLSISAWLNVIKEQDPDEECRKLATLLVDN